MDYVERDDYNENLLFFLPQFHEIKENNEWWGEGFTDWVNVKKAKPLYKNHIQPNILLTIIIIIY